jgi:hypothetical protein
MVYKGFSKLLNNWGYNDKASHFEILSNNLLNEIIEKNMEFNSFEVDKKKETNLSSKYFSNWNSSLIMGNSWKEEDTTYKIISNKKSAKGEKNDYKLEQKISDYKADNIYEKNVKSEEPEELFKDLNLVTSIEHLKNENLIDKDNRGKGKAVKIKEDIKIEINDSEKKYKEIYQQAEKAYSNQNWEEAEKLYIKLINNGQFDINQLRYKAALCILNGFNSYGIHKVNRLKGIISILKEKDELKKSQEIEQLLNEKLTKVIIPTDSVLKNENSKIEVLKDFRDNVLNQYMIGRVFISIYYKGFGKNAAFFISFFPIFKRLIKKILNIIICKYLESYPNKS